MNICLLKKQEVDELKLLLAEFRFGDFSSYRWLSKDDLTKYLLNEISNYLNDKHNFIIIAKENGQVVGLVSLIYLFWDSKHFGTEMGKISHLISTGDYYRSISIKNKLLSQLQLICKKRNIQHLSCRIEVSDSSSIHILEANHFKLMDTLLTYTFNRHKHKILPIKELYKVRRFRDKDLPILMEIATKAFSNDRFHADSLLSNKKADALYAEWIKNSCKRRETVFVATSRERPIGFLAYKIYRNLAKMVNYKIMGRGLMAVAPQAKGSLMSLMKATFRDVNLHYDCVEYDTRLDNFEVIRACQRFGLDLARAKYTFHKWLKSPDRRNL